jgi:uncharacterized protein YecE (DUF72 family)
MVRVGCCGWQKAHDTYYQHFPLIEVQKTFYKLPMVKTARRWRKDEAPSDFIFAWEPRGEWEDGQIARLCDDLDLVHCVDPFERLPVTDGLAYFRLHGIDDYYYNYTDEDLEQLQVWCDPYADAYVLFNNVSIWDDALRFQEALDSE